MSHKTTLNRKLTSPLVYTSHESKQAISIGALTRKETLKLISRMNIILLGIPGSGKTTLAQNLSKLNNSINYISIGDISRNLDPASPERQYINQLFRTKAPTGDPRFFLKLIEDKIDSARKKGRGFILDGIPKKNKRSATAVGFSRKKGGFYRCSDSLSNRSCQCT